MKIKWEFGVSRVVGINVERSNGIRLSQIHLANQIVDKAEGYAETKRSTRDGTSVNCH
jgi:hypothetical protein